MAVAVVWWCDGGGGGGDMMVAVWWWWHGNDGGGCGCEGAKMLEEVCSSDAVERPRRWCIMLVMAWW